MKLIFLYTDMAELVTTTLLISNPNEDGTCHNLDINMIEVCYTLKESKYILMYYIL